jgi:release factor glutamine methyltransferase
MRIMHNLSLISIKKLLPISLHKYAIENYSKKLLMNLKKGRTISKILKEKYFWNSKFKTTYNTLDPRWDSEILIDIFISKFKNINTKQEKYTILDMCTGTGILGISLMGEITKLRCEFVDINHKALQVCKNNIRSHKLWHKSKINKTSLEDYIKLDKYKDFLISNPPYLLKSEINNSLKEDPYISLYGGEDGLYFYRLLAVYIKKYIKYFAVIELDSSRCDLIVNIFYKNKLKNIQVFKDYGGLNRCLYCEV